MKKHVDATTTDAGSIKHLTLWHPAGFGDFRQKKHLNAHGFADEYLRSYSL